MKHWAMLAGLAGSMALCAPALAQDEVLSVTNRTGYTISEIYISPTGTDDWEEDLLGFDVLEDDDVLNIDFSRSADTCWWDILVVYEVDGEQVAWPEINFCEMQGQVALYYNGSTGETTARMR